MLVLKGENTHEAMKVIVYQCVPVHAREVTPEVTCSVSRTDFHCIDENRITLKQTTETQIMSNENECSLFPDIRGRG